MEMDLHWFPWTWEKGTTHEVFQAEGTSDVAIYMLNNLVSTGTMLPVTPL